MEGGTCPEHNIRVLLQASWSVSDLGGPRSGASGRDSRYPRGQSKSVLARVIYTAHWQSAVLAGSLAVAVTQQHESDIVLSPSSPFRVV